MDRETPKAARMDEESGDFPQDAGFGMEVLTCSAELNTRLAEMLEHHRAVVLLASLANHLGGALRVFIRDGACTAEQARWILHGIEHDIFDSDSSQCH